MFAKADATLIDGDRETPLFSNRRGGGAIHPAGHVHLESFQLHGRMPVWRYALGDRVIEQRIWLEPGANTVHVAYRLEAAGADRDLRLRVRLLVNVRDHHVSADPGGFTPQIETAGNQLQVIDPGRFTLRFQAAGGILQPEWNWIENFDLPVERERGLPEQDAHLCVGQGLVTLRPGVWVGVIASLRDDANSNAALQRFFTREATLLDQVHSQVAELAHAPDWIDQLTLAADSFLAQLGGFFHGSDSSPHVDGRVR